jgi:hypothetical protein
MKGESIYAQIGKTVGKDARVTRKVAHHPFDFLSKSMADMEDHRPIRIRYLGAFVTKPHWRKGMKKSSEVGFPLEGDCVYAKVPEEKYGRMYENLKLGTVKNARFIADDGTVNCNVMDVVWWRPLYFNLQS